MLFLLILFPVKYMKCNQNVLGVGLEKSNTLNYVSDVRQGNLMEPCTIIWLVLFEKREQSCQVR